MRRRVVWRWVLFAGLVAICLTTVGAAGARPSVERPTISASTVRQGAASAKTPTGAKNKYGIPTLPYSPALNPDAYDGTGTAGAYAPKLKTVVALPNTTFLSYLRLCTQVIQLGSDDPVTCPDFHPPTTTFDSFDNASFPIWINATGPLWIKSPVGSKLAYGSFPSVRVHTLAFGSIPVTATVTITQPVGRDGYVTALSINYLLGSNLLPAEGGEIFANKYWPGIKFGPNSGSLYSTILFKVTGKVDVQISNVELDGRPLDVGRSCRTATPGAISLGSPTGTYQNGTPATKLRGMPGGAQVLNSDDAGSAQGIVSIPAFTGCGSGREDLDPLITSLVSGPHNALDVAFTRAFTQCTNPQRTFPCPEYPQEPAPPATPARARTAAAPARATAVWNGLSTSQRHVIATRLAALPRGQRSLVLSSLPAPIAAAVRAEAR